MPINKKHLIFGFVAISSLLFGSIWVSSSFAEAIIGDPVLGADDPILGSKHDFTGLNSRAGVVAMSGVAFSDYGFGRNSRLEPLRAGDRKLQALQEPHSEFKHKQA
jgi:hypothetical protein